MSTVTIGSIGARVALKRLLLSSTSAIAGQAWSAAISRQQSNSTLAAASSDGTALTVSGATVSGTFAAGGDPAITLTETNLAATPNANTTTIGMAVTAQLQPLTLSASTFATTAAPGTLIGDILGQSPGSTLSITPNDGRVVFNAGQTALVVGMTAASAGTLNYTITETLAGAIGSPMQSGVSVVVTNQQVISLSKRLRIHNQIASVGTNNNNSTRLMETNSPGAPGGVWFEDFNGWANTGLATASDEVTAGSPGLSRYSLAYNVSGAGYNQSSATVWNATFNNIINSVPGYCYKYVAGASPTFVAANYAQFQADGGFVTISGAGHQINRPDGYYIRSDASPAIPSGALAIQMDDVRPLPITITALSQTGGLATATVASTASIVSGCYYNILGNTPAGYNVTATKITVISATQFTYAVNSGTASPATVLGTFNFVRPCSAGVINARGDILKQTPILQPTAMTQSGTTVTVTVPDTSLATGELVTITGCVPAGYNANAALVTIINGTTLTYQAPAGLGTVTTLGQIQQNLVQATDWSGVSTGLTTNGQLLSLPAAVFGMGANGMVAIAGDSNAYNGDENQLAPSGSYFLGDADAAIGYIARALNGWGYTFVNVAAVGATAGNQVTYGGGLVRRFMIRNAKAVWDEMGRNDAISGSQTFAGMKTLMTSYYGLTRSAVPGIRIIAHTFPPYTSSTDSWATRGANQTQTVANLTYPGAWIYASYIPAQLSVAQGGNGAFNGAANGAADYVFDLATEVSNAAGAHAIDGLWAADGATAFGYTIDGQHMGEQAHQYASGRLINNYSPVLIVGF